MILEPDLNHPGYARLALISGLALAFLGATYLWATRGAAIVLDMSWTGCL
jgi:hypothetical protein